MLRTTRYTQNPQYPIARKFIVFAMAMAVVLTALLSPASLMHKVSAAPGALDLSFGGTGQVLLPNYSDTSLAMQPDGKIVVAYTGQPLGRFSYLVVNRYLQSGELEWQRAVPDSVLVNSYQHKFKVLIRPDGKIVVADSTVNGSAIVIFNSNGLLDASLGPNWLNVPFGVTDAGVLPDNRLVILRISSFTILDDAGASVQTVYLPFVVQPGANRMAVGTDGRIVVVSGSQMAVYNADLTPDTSFCPGGVCILPTGAYLLPTIANDGKIILGNGEPGALAISRYLPNGSPDTAFGISGVFQLPALPYGGAPEYFSALEVDDAGRVLVARIVPYYVQGSVWVIDTVGSTAELLTGAGRIQDMALQQNGKLLISATGIPASVMRLHYSDERTTAANLRFETTRISPDETVRRGDEIVYDIKVTNSGPDKAGHVTFENSLPNGTSFVSFDAPEGWVNYQLPRFVLGKVSCSGYRLESGQSVTFRLTLRVNVLAAHGSQIVNTSQVSSLVHDPNIFNNTTTSTITVQ